MARLNLQLPKKFDFTTDIQVYINNINYGGHLGNDSLLALIHEARIRFLKDNGFTESDICGVGIIMVDTAILYKSESFHGDVLTFDVAVNNIGKVGCDFYFRVTDKNTRKEVAHAKTGILFFDYYARKVVNTPDAFRKLFL
ncbi:thioesterase [candidate division WOR_3 bacterium SM23_42]|uniref:Thioesterase n=1 Tax=candidate division WOR_3 bacterium SM23_42 TaxID=1703779 RepID=A0A0S8FQH2_UNCW3|nr:MAG: thioesterase [candidate division WOR_3 bacterium SM23_42]